MSEFCPICAMDSKIPLAWMIEVFYSWRLNIIIAIMDTTCEGEVPEWIACEGARNAGGKETSAVVAVCRDVISVAKTFY